MRCAPGEEGGVRDFRGALAQWASAESDVVKMAAPPCRHGFPRVVTLLKSPRCRDVVLVVRGAVVGDVGGAVA